MAKRPKMTTGERIADGVSQQLRDWHAYEKSGDDAVKALARRIDAAIRRAVVSSFLAGMKHGEDRTIKPRELPRKAVK